VSGDSTVAYALAFAQAAELALQVKIPERAAWLRALMAEMERLANHLGDIGGVCNDAAFSIMHSHCAVLRETVLRRINRSFWLQMPPPFPLAELPLTELPPLILACESRPAA